MGLGFPLKHVHVTFDLYELAQANKLWDKFSEVTE